MRNQKKPSGDSISFYEDKPTCHSHQSGASGRPGPRAAPPRGCPSSRLATALGDPGAWHRRSSASLTVMGEKKESTEPCKQVFGDLPCPFKSWKMAGFFELLQWFALDSLGNARAVCWLCLRGRARKGSYGEKQQQPGVPGWGVKAET